NESLRLVLVLAMVAAAGAAAAQGPPAARPDRDGDAIPDAIETQDWYRAAGGSPDRKDIWVECDTMRRVDPSRNFVQRKAAEVFRWAPVENPSGQKGIALHVTFDERLKFQRLLGDGDFGNLYDVTMEIREEHHDGRPFTGRQAETMRPYVHYCLYANAITEQGTSGVSFDSTNPGGGIPGDTFIVSIGGLYDAFARRDPETLRWEVGTFIHELGHNLGLTHGGGAPARHTTFKPHYLSVMNYHFQQGYVTVDEEGHLQRLSYWDYSRAEAGRIDERRINEHRRIDVPDAAVTAPDGTRFVGLFRGCSPQWVLWFDWGEKIDFNCNGVIDDERVVVDTNRDGRVENLGKGQDDWAHIVFDGGTLAVPGVERLSEPLLPSDELTLEEAREIDRQIRDARRSGPPQR
ncbi:MAG: hypothetical protein ACOC5E_00965, partial [Acidobacteriota bacterium]